MTTTCLFTITGFFAIRSGNRNNELHHACYDSALACINSPSIPAHIYIYNPSSPSFLPDNTIVWLLGKAYYPPPGDCRPAVIDTIECAALPSNPASNTYVNGMPDFRQPAITVTGIVSSGPQRVELEVVEFLLTVQEYVHGGMKTSTIICRMDKATTHWRNVPIPPLHSHLAFVGVCYENSAQDRLCVDMRSLNLPSMRPPLPFPTPPSDGPPEKQARISAHAPPRRPPAPPSARPSTVIAALDTANVLGLPPPTETAHDLPPTYTVSNTDDSGDAQCGPGPSTHTKGKRKASD